MPNRNFIFKNLVIFFYFAIPLPGLAQQQAKLPYQDTKLSFDQRVSDLVSRLTLEEKISQMLNTAPAIPRMGIPAYNWWSEILHGVARTSFKVTVYPQAIAMAATFDTNSLKTMGL